MTIRESNRAFGMLDNFFTYLKDNKLAIAIIGVLLLLMIASTWLRFSQFSLDSRYYYAMSLRFNGVDRETAYQTVIALQEKIWPGMYTIRPIENILDWGLTVPRVVYPLLSAPFVAMLGVAGLAVVPTIFVFFFTFGFHYFLTKRHGVVAATTVVGGLLLSTYIMRWSLGMLTESVSVVLGLASLALAYKYIEERKVGYLFALSAVTITSAFTRQATLIVAFAFIFAWIGALIMRNKDSGWGIVASVNFALAAGVQLLQSALWPFSQVDQFVKTTNSSDFFGAVLSIPRLILKVTRQEIVAYLKNDQVLLVLLILCTISVFMYLGRTESHLFIGAVAGISLYAITNGTDTQFRYALPGLIFFATTLAVLVSKQLLRFYDPQRVD